MRALGLAGLAAEVSDRDRQGARSAAFSMGMLSTRYAPGRNRSAVSASKEAQGVGGNEQRGAHVGEHRQPEGDEPGEGDRHEERLHRDGEEDILADDAHGLPAEPDDEGEARQIVRHQGNVGGLEGDVGAGGAHRHAHGGSGERRSIIDAISHHRHMLVARDQVMDYLHLLLWKELGVELIDAQLSRYGGGRAGVIARQHHRALDAGAL